MFGRSRFPRWETLDSKGRDPPLQYVVTKISCDSYIDTFKLSVPDHQILTLWRSPPQLVDGRIRKRVLGSYSYLPQHSPLLPELDSV